MRPGDDIIADGDGLIVAREHAEAVAKAAREVPVEDKSKRRELCKNPWNSLDRTVTPD